MLISKLVAKRTKENPSDAVIKSHILLMRAGYIKAVANGIWTLSMPAKRIVNKIENIIREEMDNIDGQECLFPVVMPKELWEESGRYHSIGEEFLRFKDRNDRPMVLGMTHEEAAVHLARDFVSSYQQLPFMIYQFQTKFRDEARARGGLIRVREFTMKDGYSFHMTEEDLKSYYKKAYDAYGRIFRRLGMENFIAVQSDSGMMGGSVSHEFMLLTDVGEDTLVICPHCHYSANIDVAIKVMDTVRDETSAPIEEVFTGAAKEIAEVSQYLNIKAEKTVKAVSFNVKGEETIVLCFLRGDLEVSEAKLKSVIKKDIAPVSLEDSKELVAGNIGPIGLNLKDAIIVYDKSIENANNMIIGANKKEYHITGFDTRRDLKSASFFDISKVKEGDICTVCHKPLTLKNGIEIGNIFQLGTKYTKSMGMTVLNKEGESINPIMGCYGIGVGRAVSSIAEEKADEKGLVWPMAIAPWQVYLCPLRYDDETVKSEADKLYQKLTQNGVEVLFDDREVSPGVKFSDCDLMGIPIRVVVSPRSLAKGEFELQMRDGTMKKDISKDNIVQEIKDLISEKGG